MSWLPKKLVVVPLSFSDQNTEALDIALSMVDEPAHVHVIHVLAKLSSMEPGAVWGDVTDEKRIEKARAEVMKRLAGDPRHAGCAVVVRIGQAAGAISKYVAEVKAELVVMTSRGHSRAHNFFLGSTADSVFHDVHCPVLIIKK